MAKQTRTMHGNSCPQQQGVKLGSIRTTEVNFEGTNVQAIITEMLKSVEKEQFSGLIISRSMQ